MKKALSFVLVLVLVFSFTACNKKQVVNQDLQNRNPVSNESALLDATPETVEKVTVLLKDQAIPDKNNSGLYKTSAFEDIASETGNYKYVVFEEIEGEKLEISAYPEDKFKDIYNSKGVPDYLDGTNFEKESDPFNSIVLNAEVILNTLTKEEGLLTNVPTNGENTYLTFNNTGDNISAFGIPIDIEKGLINQLKEKGLNLVFNNMTIKKFIGSDSMASDLWGCCAIVDAELTCISNDGVFKDISWIPEKGSYKNVEFTILYMSYSNDGMHSILINDIDAKVIE